MESMRDIDRAMEWEVAKGSCPLRFVKTDAKTLLVNQQICFFPGVVFPLKTSYNDADRFFRLESMTG